MLRKILPHVVIVLALVLLTFFVLDQVNSAMCFINNLGTKIIMAVECVCAFTLAVLYVKDSR